MSALAELDLLRRRLGRAEAELGELRFRVESLGAELLAARAKETRPEPVASPAVARVSPVVEPPPVLASPAPPLPIPPPPPPVFPAPASAIEPPRNRLREWLEPLQLWPPQGERNTEVRLGAWWATRLGALLAVIGVVFLGVYVSRGAPEWVRLAEVTAATGAVLALGRRLERVLPTFGAVVFGAGLALAYFCAFAAHAVRPMQVIEQPLIAMAVEIAVVGGIFVVAWRRNEPLVATMAVALGGVTAFIGLHDQRFGFGPWVVLLLGLIAVGLKLSRGWAAPSALAMPLAWLYLGAATVARRSGGEFPVGAVWFWCAIYLLLFTARDWIGARRGAALETLDRALQVTSSSLAVVVGLLALARGRLVDSELFFFGSGVSLLLLAAAWRAVRVPPLIPILVCKGAGLIALGVIDAFAGQARCLVLLAQAYVMLVSARQSHQPWLRTATVVAGGIALGCYLQAMRPSGAIFATGTTALEVVFLLGLLAFVAALRRWAEFGRTFTAVASALVGVVAIVTASRWQLHGWAPAVDVGLAVLCAGVGLGLRGGWPASVASGLLLLAAHREIWAFPTAWHGREKLWGNELAVLLAAGLAGAFSRFAPAGTRRRSLRTGLAILAATTLVIVGFKSFSPAPALAFSHAVALGLIVVAPRGREWSLSQLAVPLILLGWFLFTVGDGRVADVALWIAAACAWAASILLAVSRAHRETVESDTSRDALPIAHTALAVFGLAMAIHGNLSGGGRVLGLVAAAFGVFALAWRPGVRAALEGSWVLWGVALWHVFVEPPGWLPGLLAVAAWWPAIVLTRRPEVGARCVADSWRARAAAIQVAVATAFGAVVALSFTGAAQLSATLALVLVAFVACRGAGVASARGAVVAAAALAWCNALRCALAGNAMGWGAPLAVALAIAAVAGVLPFWLERDRAAETRGPARWLAAGMGLALAMATLVVQRGDVAPFATIGCGVAATLTFLAGLRWRSRPHRLCGLAGLALCVPRAFYVDLHSALHRIAAFVVLGVVLLAVGFSYERFRHFIDDDKKI